MFASDIHGNISRFDEMMEIFYHEKCNKLVILGDTSSYSDELDNIYIAKTLNDMANKVEVIRGNCDTFSFEENLKIPMFDCDNIFINGRIVTVTHGHYYHSSNLPENCGEIFIQGHTHIPLLQKINGRIFGNPGSVTRPRGSDLRCYIIMDNDKMVLKTLGGKIVKEIIFED